MQKCHPQWNDAVVISVPALTKAIVSYNKSLASINNQLDILLSGAETPSLIAIPFHSQLRGVLQIKLNKS